MSSIASKLAATANHPWEDLVLSFGKIEFPVFVIQIDDENYVRESLKSASEAYSRSRHELAAATFLSDLALKFRMVACTPAVSTMMGLDPKQDNPGTVRKIVSTMSVPNGLSLLSYLLTGSISEAISTVAAHGSPGMQIRILARSKVGELAYLLVSPNSLPASHVMTQSIGCYERAMDMSVELLMTISLDGKVELANQGMALIVGAECATERKDISAMLTASSNRCFSTAAITLLADGKPWHGRIEFSRGPKEEPVAAFCQISSLMDSSKKELVGYCISGYRLDTDNFLSKHTKPLKEAIAEGDRLSVIGKMTSNVIHEINNPITVINGKAEKIIWLLSQKGEPVSAEALGQLGDSADKILKMTDRINRIIHGMKNLSRNSEGEKFSVESVSKLTGEVQGLLEIICQKSGVKIKFAAIDPAIEIKMQYLAISQVLVNLLNNGLDAVKGTAGAWVSLDVEADQNWLYMKVADSGTNLPEEVKSRLFEGYFSTKALGQGTGIGLPLSLEIAKRHGGDLYLDTMTDNTTFVLKLPRREGLNPKESSESWEEI